MPMKDGKDYLKEVLKITRKEKTLADVFEMMLTPESTHATCDSNQSLKDFTDNFFKSINPSSSKVDISHVQQSY